MRVLLPFKKVDSIREFKDIEEKYLCKFNEFLSFFFGGVDFMNGFIAFNSYVMSPVSKDSGDLSFSEKVINLFFDGFTLSIEGIKRSFKNTSTAAGNYRWMFFKPENLLKVFKKRLNIFRKRFMGIGLGWFRKVFKELDITESWRKLKVFNSFFNIFIALKGGLYLGKHWLATVWASGKAAGMNNLNRFASKSSFINNFIRVKAGYGETCFIIASRASKFNIHHRRLPCI